MASRTKQAPDISGGAAAQALNVALMRSTALGACGSALLGLVGMIIQNEVAWYYNTIAKFGPLCPDARDETCDPRVTAAMWPIHNQRVALDVIRAVLVTLPTVVALVCIWRFYGALLHFDQIKNRQPPTATLMSVPHLRWPLLVELLGIAVHVVPGVETLSNAPDLYLFLSQVGAGVKGVFLSIACDICFVAVYVCSFTSHRASRSLPQ